jgi:glutathione S-transferase
MVEDDFVLWESNPIMRYLAEGQGGALIPADRRVRAKMEQWFAWQQNEFSPAATYAFLALGRPTPGYDDPQQIARSIERWTAKVAILEGQLAGGLPFLVGDMFTLADIAVGLALHRWQVTPFDKPALPLVNAYYERLKARPAGAPYLGPKTP